MKPYKPYTGRTKPIDAVFAGTGILCIVVLLVAVTVLYWG
jgi:hypothetical protein